MLGFVGHLQSGTASREGFNAVCEALAPDDDGSGTDVDERFAAWAEFVGDLERVVAHAAAELAMGPDEIGLSQESDDP